eukprot:jgi/Hompol1/6552/HPOL_000219-RA
MEIELKLRLMSKADHSAVLALFHKLDSAKFLGTDYQENFFLDGPSRSFESVRRTFRLRRVRRFDALTNTETPKSVVTLKGNGKINNGVGVTEELEEPLSDEILGRLVQQPTLLPELAFHNTLLQKVQQEHPEAGALELVGSFKNQRSIFSWNDLKLEIDETQYPFGNAWEIEVETESPQKAKDLL